MEEITQGGKKKKEREEGLEPNREKKATYNVCVEQENHSSFKEEETTWRSERKLGDC